MPELTDEEFAQAAGVAPTAPAPATAAVNVASPSQAPVLLPNAIKALTNSGAGLAGGAAARELAAGAAAVPQPGTRGVALSDAVAARERNLARLGKQPGVPFNEQGLDVWTDFLTRARENKDGQLRFLAKRFGPDNVRLNELGDPVVRVRDEKTGSLEDFPLNPQQLTVRSLTRLADHAPDVAGALLGVYLGGPTRGVLARSLLGALGGEAGATVRQVGTEAIDRPLADVDVHKSLVEHLANVPMDVLADLGLAGVVKGTQVVKGVVTGQGLPNPLARTPVMQPARPEFTREGLAAAARNQARSGIDPAIRPSEASGIPLVAMLEQYMERKPAGATPLIQAGAQRDEASKAFQRWLIDPATLPSDEEVGRRGLNALKAELAPLEANVATARTAAEAEGATLQSGAAGQVQASLLQGFGVTAIPTRGVPLAETGDLLRRRFIDERDTFRKKSGALYDAFFDNPLAKEPIVSGAPLKASIDELRASLPKVTKEAEAETGLFDLRGNPLMRAETRETPISTPIRPRLDELSAKLAGGNVSINDLKQVRTDLDDAIKVGEAVPGVKEGRLKAAYRAVTGAIQGGLREINDPALTQAWKDATDYYASNVERFTEKNVARLAKEAEQTSSVGNAEFVRRAVGNADTYTALRQFYGAKSPELTALHNAAKSSLIEDALGPGDLVDGGRLATALRGLRRSNPELFADALGGRGVDFLRAAEQLGGFQQRLPLDEVAKLLAPGAAAGAPSGKLLQLQTAEKRLADAYQNEVVNKFLRGNLPASQLQPDKFVGYLPQAKLSDVKEVVAQVQRQDPAAAELLKRKAVQSLIWESRRTPSPADVMGGLQGRQGEIVSGSGIDAALGKGDQREKYKALLGGLYEPLVDYAKTELLGEERKRVAGGVGMLAPGSAMNMFIKALTPWEGSNKAEGIFKELGSLARDKIVSVALANDSIRKWLTTPYALRDASTAIKAFIVSEPFLDGLKQEFQDESKLHQVAAALKVGFGMASRSTGAASGGMSDDEFQRAAGGAPTPLAPAAGAAQP